MKAIEWERERGKERYLDDWGCFSGVPLRRMNPLLLLLFLPLNSATATANASTNFTDKIMSHLLILQWPTSRILSLTFFENIKKFAFKVIFIFFLFFSWNFYLQCLIFYIFILEYINERIILSLFYYFIILLLCKF